MCQRQVAVKNKLIEMSPVLLSCERWAGALGHSCGCKILSFIQAKGRKWAVNADGASEALPHSLVLGSGWRLTQYKTKLQFSLLGEEAMEKLYLPC